MKKEEKTAEQLVADGDMVTGNYTIQAQLGKSGKSFTVSGYIYSHNDAASINKQVDLMHDVVDRQQTRAEIPILEATLEQRILQLSQVRDHLTGLNVKNEQAGKLSSAEKKNIQDLNGSISVLLKDIEKGEQAIADAKKKVGI
jgi:hypothetical protein